MLKIKFTIKNRLCLVDLKPEAREAVMGTVVNQVRDLVDEHMRGNGGREFWQEAADSIKVSPLYRAKDGKLEARLEIYKRGVHLRYAGGIVKPTGNISEMTGKPTKSLLIPSRELRADGGDLYDYVRDPRKVHVIKNKAGRVYLVEDGAEGAKMRLLGRLVKSTTHKPNPRVLPTREEMATRARNKAHEALRLYKEKLIIQQ